MSGRCQKSLDEIHRYGIPRTLQNRKLFQQTIRFVTLRLSTHTSSTRFAILFDCVVESWPSIVSLDKTNCLILTWMTGKYVIVLIAKNAEAKVGRIRNIDYIVVEEKTVGRDGIMRPGTSGMGNV